MSNATLDYLPPDPKRGAERLRRAVGTAIALVLTLPLVLTMALLAANLYASWNYAGIRPGMTRAQVDRRLWAFAAARNTAYNAMPPGHTMVTYELLRLGKSTRILVQFDPAGKVSGVVPAFDQ